jgi:predicted RNA-binding protein with PUA-like domain
MTRRSAPERPRRYWLFKTEPGEFSFADLLAAPRRRTGWDGVRNYQARNLLRDELAVGDGVLIYHSSADPLAITGIARVTRAGHPDPTAFAPDSAHFDPKSDPESPTWYQVEIEAVIPLPEPLLRARLAAEPQLRKMMLLQRGSRLSVQPVTAAEWERILQLAGVRADW